MARGRGARRRRLRARLRRWLLRALLAWVLVSALPVAILRYVTPPTSAFMLTYQVERALGEEPGAPPLRHRWVPYRAIAPVMRLAVVASEDQKFPYHHGFDVGSIAEAIATAEHGGRLRGASTISQQVAKNLFLWSGRSYVRKAIEAWFTVLLELLWSKRRILEVYLNVAEFGRGIYGVGTAAEVFFGVPPARLSRREAALLAAVLPDPRALHAGRPSPYVRERADWIERQMHNLGAGYLAGL